MTMTAIERALRKRARPMGAMGKTGNRGRVHMGAKVHIENRIPNSEQARVWAKTDATRYSWTGKPTHKTP